ncbi:putative heme binding protein [Trypoxylus dichotomus]
MLIIVDPAYNRHILVKDFHDFHFRGFYCNKKDQPISLNLVTSEGEDWRKLRIKFSPTFTTVKMKIMFDLMLEVTKAMEKYFEEHAARKVAINAEECAGYYTTDIVATCSFGMETNSFKDAAFSEVVKTLLHESTKFTKMCFCIALPKLANFLGIPLFEKKGADYLCNLLNETVKNRAKSKIIRNDFLQIILELKREYGISDSESNGHCLLFLLAGFETVGSIFTFALFELAVNEDIQDKLRVEVNEVLEKHGGNITYEAVNAMKYLEMIISEVLRKYPSVPILNRTSVTDATLPNTDLVIEKGTKIIIPVMGFHYDPEYFPNPDKFDPDRFSIENKPKIKPYTYIPFGEGPRGCLGERFAKQTLKVGLLAVIRRYRLKLNPRVKLPLEYRSTIALTPATDILIDVQQIKEA